MSQIKCVIGAAAVLSTLGFGQPSNASVSISDCNFNPVGDSAEQLTGKYGLTPAVLIIAEHPDQDLEYYGITDTWLSNAVELGLRANGFSLNNDSTSERALVKTKLILHNVSGTSIYIFNLEISVERNLWCSGFGNTGMVGPFVVWELGALGHNSVKGLNARVASSIRQMIDEFSLKFYRANDSPGQTNP